jgi:hypothetical protein
MKGIEEKEQATQDQQWSKEKMETHGGEGGFL